MEDLFNKLISAEHGNSKCLNDLNQEFMNHLTLALLKQVSIMMEEDGKDYVRFLEDMIEGFKSVANFKNINDVNVYANILDNVKNNEKIYDDMIKTFGTVEDQRLKFLDTLSKLEIKIRSIIFDDINDANSNVKLKNLEKSKFRVINGGNNKSSRKTDHLHLIGKDNEN